MKSDFSNHNSWLDMKLQFTTTVMCITIMKTTTTNHPSKP